MVSVAAVYTNQAVAVAVTCLVTVSNVSFSTSFTFRYVSSHQQQTQPHVRVSIYVCMSIYVCLSVCSLYNQINGKVL